MLRKAAEQYWLLSRALFRTWMRRSEAELMVRYEVGMFNHRKEAFEKKLFKNSGGNG
jgi:hypothetical protein